MAPEEATASEPPVKSQETDVGSQSYSRDHLVKPDPSYFKELKTKPKRKTAKDTQDMTFKDICLKTLEVVGQAIRIAVGVPIVLALIVLSHSGSEVGF